ncbi:alcohol dehydrogenase catalytic domain-containing protein [Streptosporangiaceae bacterium NEAU-GS5]|nr:alcohol dehydrogenase catalytic domain-containing protein [Streptosporangiaceae bacterium NEAU-GS5]
MRAARYYGRHDIRVEETAEPTLHEPDEVLVEVSHCGICGTDLHEYEVGPIVTRTEPHPLTGATLPQTLGHEFAGRVVATGDLIRDVAVGDRVSVMPAIVCGRCPYCRRGMGNLCLNFACTGLSAATGGLARYAVLKDYQVFRVPDAVSDVAAAVVEPAAVAAYGVDRAVVRGGDVVLVTGAGPVGALSALYASAIGAGLVIVAEPNPKRAALARTLDVGPVLDPAEESFAGTIAELTEGLGVDVAVECSGTTAGLAACVTHTRRAGTVVQTGLHTKPATVDAMALSEKDLSLLGSWCYRLTDWPRVMRLVATGRYPIERVVTSHIGLEDVVPKGFDVLVDPAGDELKVLVSAA